MRKLFFVDCDKMTVVDRHTALNDCVVNGSAHADSAEHAFGVKARADELEPARDLPLDVALENAGSARDRYFRVPSILGEGESE